MKGIVDRIENGILVLEIDEKYLNLDVNLFPKNIKEGDLVVKDGARYKILIEETKKRNKKMDDLLKSLFDKDKD